MWALRLLFKEEGLAYNLIMFKYIALALTLTFPQFARATFVPCSPSAMGSIVSNILEAQEQAAVLRPFESHYTLMEEGHSEGSQQSCSAEAEGKCAAALSEKSNSSPNEVVFCTKLALTSQGLTPASASGAIGLKFTCHSDLKVLGDDRAKALCEAGLQCMANPEDKGSQEYGWLIEKINALKCIGR